VLFDSPLRTNDEINAMVSADAISIYLEELGEAEAQFKVRLEEDREKIKFLRSTHSIAAYLLELEKRPSLKNTVAHLNKHFIFIPAMIAAHR
ncbi:MAG: hypothetical protein HY537_06095, partial [Deltaproteobacteria bacterium]|nr:hypothetical protein [Deltaproteobacteria bacterium]